MSRYTLPCAVLVVKETNGEREFNSMVRWLESILSDQHRQSLIATDSGNPLRIQRLGTIQEHVTTEELRLLQESRGKNPQSVDFKDIELQRQDIALGALRHKIELLESELREIISSQAGIARDGTTRQCSYWSGTSAQTTMQFREDSGALDSDYLFAGGAATWNTIQRSRRLKA